MLHFHQFLLSCWLVLAIVAAVEESKPESVSTDLAAEESRHYGGYGVRRNGGYGGGGHRYGGYRGRRSIIDDAIQVFLSLHLLHPASTSRLTLVVSYLVITSDEGSRSRGASPLRIWWIPRLRWLRWLRRVSSRWIWPLLWLGLTNMDFS